MIEISELFDLNKTIACDLFAGHTYPWEVLSGIHDFIIDLGLRLSPDEFFHPTENIWISKDAEIAPSAYIGPYCIIDSGARINHCAYVRENSIVGKGATVGNSTELKNVVLFDGVEVPHYNYVGDSILGYKAHMGAGAITSNLKADKKNVVVKCGSEKFETGIQKIGAFLGDFAEIGCNSVLNPGTVICRHSNVYPLSCVRGTVPPNSIFKSASNVVLKHFPDTT